MDKIILPPIDTFFKGNPMQQWINKCIPFKPKKKDKYKIDFIPLELSGKIADYIEFHKHFSYESNYRRTKDS